MHVKPHSYYEYKYSRVTGLEYWNNYLFARTISTVTVTCFIMRKALLLTKVCIGI